MSGKRKQDQTSTSDTHEMVYSSDDACGLLMNIMGHDVIHDYGVHMGDSRWKKVDEIIDTFILKNMPLQTGGGEGDDDKEEPDSFEEDTENELKDTQESQKSRDEVVLPITPERVPPGRGLDVSPTTDSEISPPRKKTNNPPENKALFEKDLDEEKAEPQAQAEAQAQAEPQAQAEAQAEELASSLTEELEFEEVMDYIKQAVHIRMFLYKMEHMEPGDKSGGQAGGERSATGSVFSVFSDYIWKFMDQFIDGPGYTADDNAMDVVDGEKEPATESVEPNNSLYELYEFITQIKTNSPVTRSDEEKGMLVSFYNTLYENKFEKVEDDEINGIVMKSPDISEFVKFVETMAIPATKEEFAASTFMNSDDFDDIMSVVLTEYQPQEVSFGVEESVLRLESPVLRDDAIPPRQRSRRILAKQAAEELAKKIAHRHQRRELLEEKKAAEEAHEREAESLREKIKSVARVAAKTAQRREMDNQVKYRSSPQTSAQSGQPEADFKATSAIRYFREDLMTYLAKTTLFLCSRDSDSQEKSSSGFRDIETEILRNVASGKDIRYEYDAILREQTESYIEALSNVSKITAKDICTQSKNKYIINNATNLLSINSTLKKTQEEMKNNSNDAQKREKLDRKNQQLTPFKDKSGCIFCPVTSIIDAQRQCSFRQGNNVHLVEGEMEYGNMNFTITEKGKKEEEEGGKEASYKYNGALTLRKGGKNPSSHIVNLNVSITTPKMTMTGFKFNNIRLYGKSDGTNMLSASFVLEQSLQQLFAFFQSQNAVVKSHLKKANSNRAYLSNLFELATSEKFTEIIFNYNANNTHYFGEYIQDDKAGNLNALGVLFSKILFKGCGDLFQEINAVCKYGGYINTTNSVNERYEKYTNARNVNVIHWNGPKIKRLVLSNDRPSAARSMVMLAQGKSGINTAGQAGFLNNNGILFAIERNSSEKDYKAEGTKKNRTGGKTGGSRSLRQRTGGKTRRHKKHRKYTRRARTTIH